MKQIYLCRHGETEWTLSGQHTGKTDLPLTPKGVEQVERLRKRLYGIHFEKIYTSPRQRAMQTCLGMDAVVEPLAVECDYGAYEGLTTAEIHKKDPNWQLFKDGAPGGESLEQIGKRADLLLKKIDSYHGNVALFSHGHFLRVLTARFLGLEVSDAKLFMLSVASLSILSYERKQPVIALWND